MPSMSLNDTNYGRGWMVCVLVKSPNGMNSFSTLPTIYGSYGSAKDACSELTNSYLSPIVTPYGMSSLDSPLLFGVNKAEIEKSSQ